MSGLVFSNDLAEKLIATYSTPDLVRQRENHGSRIKRKVESAQNERETSEGM